MRTGLVLGSRSDHTGRCTGNGAGRHWARRSGGKVLPAETLGTALGGTDTQGRAGCLTWCCSPSTVGERLGKELGAACAATRQSDDDEPHSASLRLQSSARSAQ
jgi:hypothetical protein